MPENIMPYVGQKGQEYRCVYCSKAGMFDLPTLKDHEQACEVKRLRIADWKRLRETQA
jgi:hypothetical protein